MKNCNCGVNNPHPSHEKQMPRLNRISGQLEGIKKMIQDCRYCPEILIQFKAIRSAIKSVEREILNSHLKACVAESFKNEAEKDEKIDEIIKLISSM